MVIKRKHKSKRRRKDWHHRVPDFKLVYCRRARAKKPDSRIEATQGDVLTEQKKTVDD